MAWAKVLAGRGRVVVVRDLGHGGDDWGWRMEMGGGKRKESQIVAVVARAPFDGKNVA